VTPWEAFFEVHKGLPREGAGSDDCTREALMRLGPLPQNPVVIDLGCGPGAQTLVLAETLQTIVTAVDRHQPFLDELASRARHRGLDRLIRPHKADFAALPPKPSNDLVWSEGAAFVLGFENALRTWRKLLKPHGFMVVTECSWLSDMPTAEASTFWNKAYPAMGSIVENRARADTAGFDVLDTFALPPSAWWDEYYTPMEQRCDTLEKNTDEALTEAINNARQEVDLYRRYGESYGYVFFLMRRRD
jgi:trans-aconitate methyltransferase